MRRIKEKGKPRIMKITSIKKAKLHMFKESVTHWILKRAKKIN